MAFPLVAIVVVVVGLVAAVVVVVVVGAVVVDVVEAMVVKAVVAELVPAVEVTVVLPSAAPLGTVKETLNLPLALVLNVATRAAPKVIVPIVRRVN